MAPVGSDSICTVLARGPDGMMKQQQGNEGNPQQKRTPYNRPLEVAFQTLIRQGMGQSIRQGLGLLLQFGVFLMDRGLAFDNRHRLRAETVPSRSLRLPKEPAEAAHSRAPAMPPPYAETVARPSWRQDGRLPPPGRRGHPAPDAVVKEALRCGNYANATRRDLAAFRSRRSP